MKFFIPCFLLVFGCFIHRVSAQNDSLINVLEKTLQLQINSLGVEHPDIAVYFDSLGKMYINVPDYSKADSLFNKALGIKIKNKEENHPDIADSYFNLGNVSMYAGDYKKAIHFHNKALNIRLKIFDEQHPDVAESYTSLGVFYARKSNYEKAIVFFNKALDIQLKIFGEQHLDVAYSYNNMGNCYMVKGDYEKAINFFSKGLDIRLEILDSKHPDLAYSYASLGIVHMEIGSYEKAISYNNKAIDILSVTFGKNHPGVATVYHNLATAYYYTSDNKNAIMLGNKALNIRLKVYGEQHPDVVASYGNLGLVHLETKNYERAIECFNKAIDIHLEILGENHYGVAVYYSGLGAVYQNKGDYEKAIRLLVKALNIRLKVFGEQVPRTLESYGYLAVAYERDGQYEKADSLWHVVIPQIEKQIKSNYLSFDNNRRIKYSSAFILLLIDNFYSFNATNGSKSTIQLATNFLLNTKSLALEYAVSTSQLIKNIKDNTLIAQYEQLNSLNKQIAGAEKLTNEERQAKGTDLSEIREERDNIAFEVLQHDQLKSKLNTEDIKWQDIQHHLAPDAVTVDFLKIYEQKDSLWAYYAILIHKNYASPKLVRIADEKILTKSLKTGKNERPYYLNDRRTAKALYKILWQPIEQYLEGIKTVHISPSGILHRVPFESLRNETNKYLAEQYEFHYYPTIRDILKEKPQKTNYKDMVIMGHILYDLDEKDEYEAAEEDMALRGNTRDSIQPLPETLREVTAIKRTAKRARLKTKLLTIDAASEDAVQYFIKDKAPSIFHFATHGVFLPPLEAETDHTSGSRDRLRAADNPLQRSALMLYGANETWTKGNTILGSGEDGILTALEVSTLDLQNTDLVVLSACSTGLGNVHNTEGVFGLQRAFKLAGVNHVIASLWDVDDEATKDLMVKFYENLLQKKQAPATALRNAKNELREAGYEPQDWAGFILIE